MAYSWGMQTLVAASITSAMVLLLLLMLYRSLTAFATSERRLRESQERLTFALEGSGDGVWDWDIANDKVSITRDWVERMGYQEHQFGDTMSGWVQAIHPEDLPTIMAAVRSNLEGKTNSYSLEHRIFFKDGRILWILSRGMVVQRDANGRALRMVGTHSDVSARKKLERMKSDFISTVSHELRTPLTSIRGALGLLEGGGWGPCQPRLWR